MAKLSPIEIATTQRHVLLLRKVQETKPLTRAELAELKRYERKAAGKRIVKITSKGRPKKKTPKVAARAGRRKKKPGKKKRKARPPVDVAEIRRLGLECENFTEADAELKTRRSLSGMLKKYPELRAAWDRGRFLRNLRDQARGLAGLSEAAKRLGFVNGLALRTVLEEDMEVADLWNQTRFQVLSEIRMGLLESAKEGKADAVRAVENLLLEEREKPKFDPSRITLAQLIEVTGKARQRIHEWVNKYGLQRNADKTYDMSIVWAWFEEYLLKKVSAGKEPSLVLDPLKALKAERLELELKKHRGELLDRKEVMAGLIARHQILLSWAGHRIDELSRLCQGQKPERIAELIKEAVVDLRMSLCRVPEELRLPEDVEKLFLKTLESLPA